MEMVHQTGIVSAIRHLNENLLGEAGRVHARLLKEQIVSRENNGAMNQNGQYHPKTDASKWLLEMLVLAVEQNGSVRAWIEP